jgi:hypothetical protein
VTGWLGLQKGPMKDFTLKKALKIHLKQGVCHTEVLPFTLKRVFRQKKKNYGNSNISPCKNI